MKAGNFQFKSGFPSRSTYRWEGTATCSAAGVTCYSHVQPQHLKLKNGLLLQFFVCYLWLFHVRICVTDIESYIHLKWKLTEWDFRGPSLVQAWPAAHSLHSMQPILPHASFLYFNSKLINDKKLRMVIFHFNPLNFLLFVLT